MNKYEQWKYNFGALPRQDYKLAKVAIFQFPYDSTTSFGSGTKEGPAAIVRSSRFLDEMSVDDNGRLLEGMLDTDIFLLDEFILSRNSAKEAVEGVEQAIGDWAVSKGKFPLVLGGEHSITSGVTSALKPKNKNFGVLQIDAHTDFLNTFEGSKYSHACVMRRIFEQKLKITQVGIRNENSEIKEFLSRASTKKQVTTFYGTDMPIQKILKSLPKDVYITIDLDGLDPSIMPSVGTPEPGGLLWQDLLMLLESVFKSKNVIGVDMVELAPIPGLTAPDFLAAKLAYEIIKNTLKRKI